MRADAQKSRRLLLDAACALLIEVGPDASLEAIARRAGVGIATLYRHFPQRSALVRAVAVDVMARTYAEAAAVPAEEALRRLRCRFGGQMDLACLHVDAPGVKCRCSDDEMSTVPRGESAAGCDCRREARTDCCGPATGFASRRCRFR